MSQRPKCQACHKTLPKIGRNRQNGRGNFNDWAKRPYHVGCLKEIRKDQAISEFIELVKKAKKDLDPARTETSSLNQSPDSDSDIDDIDDVYEGFNENE